MNKDLFSKRNLLGLAILALLLIYYGSFLTHKINLVTADLGRHIQNGRVFFETGKIVSTNFYSYTQPDNYVVNHHWGAGVIFYSLWKVGGLTLIQIFFVILSLLTFYLMFQIASEWVGIGTAALIAIPVIPLLAERTEVRPEVLSNLFAALFFVLLWRFKQGRVSLKTLLWVLPIITIVWANTHIFFFFGILILGCFLAEAAWQRLRFRSPDFKKLLGLEALVVLASFINAFGYRGVIEPLIILRHYGYALVENQSVLFIERIFQNANFLIFKIVFAVLAISVFFALWRNKTRISLANLLLAAGLSFAAWWQIRNFAFFGFFALPIISANLHEAWPSLPERLDEQMRKLAMICLSVLFVIVMSGNLNRFFPYWHEFGLGLEKNNGAATDFFKVNNLHGPIFNNYDIGGYLIYYLYPRERVFVDNRPEAYAVSFFQNLYIPMQENEALWKEEENKYGFQSIIFSYHDATPWGQKFLIKRVDDPEWAPVFVDQYVIIFIKRTLENQAVIQKYQIPRSNFQVLHN